MSRRLPRLVTGPLIAAAVLLGVWGLTHRGTSVAGWPLPRCRRWSSSPRGCSDGWAV